MMVIAFVVEWSGVSEAQYHAVRQALTVDGQLAPGEICHIPKVVAAGWRFVDVWESEEAFRAFFADRLAAFLYTTGLQPPQVTPWPSYCPPAANPLRTRGCGRGVDRRPEALCKAPDTFPSKVLGVNA
jgi:hypothetical protein